MNTKTYIYLLANPEKINQEHQDELSDLIAEYPYFQSARAIHLKGLIKTNSFKYNQALKKTAAYTVDRSVLFNFITSQNFEITPTVEIPILEISSTIVLTASVSEFTPKAPLYVFIPLANAVALAAESVIKSLEEEVLIKPTTGKRSKFDVFLL